MNTNDVLKRLRFAIRLSDPQMTEMLKLGGSPIGKDKLDSFFLKEDEEGYATCPRVVLEALLDGMVIKYRGRKEEKPAAESADWTRPIPPSVPLDNNMILKKIRIALELKEDDLLAIMRLGDMEPSKNELGALFRRPGQKNYRECLDQFLRGFLTGLAKYNLRRSRESVDLGPEVTPT
ncbi:MAG: DUF1456 family protein [Spirochaetales bacterium]|nr:MAG: DUF1456 family protein [Spirochaetales bacterium]